MNTLPIILTGDRPTGSLHLGHYVGSLRQRVALQQDHQQYVLIADLQGLTDNGSNPQKIRDNIPQVLADYLAVGIDPTLDDDLPAIRVTRPRRINGAVYEYCYRRPSGA